MFLRINKLVSLIACGLFTQAAFVPSVLADQRTTDDYIALVFEAEDDDTRGERWVLMNSGTPEQDNDPDGNHSDGAVGGAYIELLPDMRVTHDDEFGPPTAMWDQPGTGPKAEYTMTFPEAGRYYVHLRAYSTGTEDNGIHVGINDSWPDSGARMQFCTAGSGWQWSGRQRDSGGAGPCGAKKTIWITVPEAGEHTFMISAREDGFEADRIMLIKDLSNNTRICSPTGTDSINCVNGSLENTDEVVDMAVSATISETETNLDTSVVLSVTARNNDGYDSAEDAQVIVGDSIGTQWNATGLQDGCSIGDGVITCNMGTVSPSHPGEEGDRPFEFILEPLQSGTFEVLVSVKTSGVDGNQNNDEANLTVTVLDDDNDLSAMSVQFSGTSLTWQENEQTDVAIVASNDGSGSAADAVLSLSLSSGLIVSAMPSGCTGTTDIQCNVGTLAANAQTSLNFGITPTIAGMLSLNVEADASNQNGEAASATMIADVEVAAVSVVDTTIDETETTDPVDTDAVDGTTTAVAKKSGLGATVWWVLLVLSFVLYTRQIHLTRLGRRSRLAVARHIS